MSEIWALPPIMEWLLVENTVDPANGTFPDVWITELTNASGGIATYRPLFSIDTQFSTPFFAWSQFNDEDGKLWYTAGIRVTGPGFLFWEGAIRFWPQEDVENPIRVPWIEAFTYTITLLNVENQVATYRMVPHSLCWPGHNFPRPS